MNTKLYNKVGYLLGIIILSNIIVSSCVNIPFKYVFTGGRYRYWHFVEGKILDTADYFRRLREDSLEWLIDTAINSRNSRRSLECYYVDKYGNFIIFYDRGDKFEEYDGGDYMYNDTWKQLNDTTIRIGSVQYVIKSCTFNRILLKHIWEDGAVLCVDTFKALKIVDVPPKNRGYRKAGDSFKKPSCKRKHTII